VVIREKVIDQFRPVVVTQLLVQGLVIVFHRENNIGH